MLVVGRFSCRACSPRRRGPRSPELFLAVSLLVVILVRQRHCAAGLSPIIGALIAGLLIAETEYRSEVEVVTAPFRGLALGVFLITVGMSIDSASLLNDWPLLLGALAGVILVKALVTGAAAAHGGRPDRGRARKPAC